MNAPMRATLAQAPVPGSAPPPHPQVRAADDDDRTLPQAEIDAAVTADDDERTVSLEAPVELPPPSSPTPGLSLEAVRLRQLHRNAPYTLLLHVFACVIATVVLAGRTPLPALATWVCGGFVLAVLQLYDQRRTRPLIDQTAALQAWERRLAGSLLLQSGLWVLLFAATPLATIFERLPVQMLALATAFTATVVFATSLRCYLALVPLTAAGQLLWMTRAQPTPSEALFIIALYAVILITGLLSFRRVQLAGIAASRDRRMLMAEQAAVFDSSLVGLAHVHDSTFVRVNQEFARIYGLPQAALEGASTRQVYPDEAAWQRAMEAGRAHNAQRGLSYERAYMRPDGQRRHLRIQARVVMGGEYSNDRIYSVVDITETHKAEKVLAAREQAYRSLAETYRVITSTAPGLVWAMDASGVYTFLGERGCQEILGVTVGEAMGKRTVDLVTLITRAQDRTAFALLRAGEVLRDHVSEIIKRNGERAFISTSGGPLRDADGRVTGICGITIDVTGRERDAVALQQAQQMVTSAIESLSDGFALFGADGRVSLCNRRFAELMEPGKTLEEMIGVHISEMVRYRVRHGQVIPPEFLGDEAAWIAARLRIHQEADGTPSQYQITDGRWIQTTKRRTPDGGVVGIYTDITALKRTEEAVRVLAQHDALTGLPNRRLLEDRLAQALTRAKRETSLVGLLLIDLDGFKPVNDRHGHRAGDEVLRVVAQRLRDCVRAVDTVARVGGDEFVIVLDALASGADAGAVAAKVIDALARPIEPVWMTMHSTAPFQIGGSIGIALYPQDGSGPDELMRQADAAMYQAKDAGRGRFVYCSAPVQLDQFPQPPQLPLRVQAAPAQPGQDGPAALAPGPPDPI